MKSAAILVVFGTLVCGVLGAQWHSEAFESPNHPNECHDDITGEYHAVGESWRRPNKCEGLACRTGSSKGVMSITGTTCAYYTKLPSNCHVTPEKAEVAYPDCCPKMECDGEPNGPIGMIG